MLPSDNDINWGVAGSDACNAAAWASDRGLARPPLSSPCGVQAPLLREFQDESRSRRGAHAPTQHDTCCKHAALG